MVISRRERGHPFVTGHEEDWQPYHPVDAQSNILHVCDNRILYILIYVEGGTSEST